MIDITNWKDLLEIDWEFLDIVVIKIKIFMYDNRNFWGISRKLYEEEIIKYFVYRWYNTADFLHKEFQRVETRFIFI